MPELGRQLRLSQTAEDRLLLIRSLAQLGDKGLQVLGERLAVETDLAVAQALATTLVNDGRDAGYERVALLANDSRVPPVIRQALQATLSAANTASPAAGASSTGRTSL